MFWLRQITKIPCFLSYYWYNDDILRIWKMLGGSEYEEFCIKFHPVKTLRRDSDVFVIPLGPKSAA